MNFRRAAVAFVLTLSASSSAFTVLPHQSVYRHVASTTELQAAEVKRLPGSAVEIEIPVPGDATKAAYDKVCTELSKTISIPGFRKGSKIPPPVLEQAMSAKGGRNALKVQAINELTNQLVESTLKEQALEPIGAPALTIPPEELAESYTPGEPLTLPVKCDVWPEIKWHDPIEGQEKAYTGLTGTYSRKPFDQEKMDKALSDLKERYATLEPISDTSHKLQMGDACTVNMVGYMAAEDGVSKGEPLPNAASGDNVEVVLGQGRYMEGLVEGLIGATVGETKIISVNFPEALRDKSLAGKRAIFDVTVEEASKRSVPEVTDEFANTVRAGLTAEGLHAELRKAIDEEDAKEFAPARNQALMLGLADRLEVEVPDTLITNQAREKFAVMMSEMRDNGTDDEEIKKLISQDNFLKYKDVVKPQIEKDFKVSMATDEVARLEGITVPDFQVEEQMENIRKDAGKDEEFDEKMIRAKVETTLVRNAVMDWLAEHSTLEVKYEDPEEFDEAMMEQLAEGSLEREKKLAEEADASGVVDAEVIE